MAVSSASHALDALLEATNTHDFDNVEALLADDVIYFFTDETVIGRAAAREYFENTWRMIREEQYWAEEVEWLVDSADSAVVTYRYRWSGLYEGQPASGSGRATNVFRRDADGTWLVVHEHLSRTP